MVTVTPTEPPPADQPHLHDELVTAARMLIDWLLPMPHPKNPSKEEKKDEPPEAARPPA